MTKSRLSPAARSAARAWRIAVGAPQVITYRLTQMVAAGASPSARDREEFHRMGAEKAEAFVESMAAMGSAWLTMQQEMAMAAWTMWFAPWSAGAMLDPALRVLDKGMVPIERRVRANARRLGRAKKR